MKELIEKQAVIDALLAKMDTIDDKPDVVLGMAVAAGMIKDIPSVTPVEKQEPCEDAISRQAVLEAIRKCHCEEWVKADIGAPIEALTSVTPAEKVGRWIEHSDGIGEWWECSQCGAHGGEGMKYCMFCGAKMSASQTNCSTCILDNTDACTRGAGRAVDDEACEDYLASPTGAEGSEE